ncbi:uncharacterized protein BX663DRAFT_523076 [Cokeromyces recurvatus]|uniref:uncharacterized protein n=1 Tax=Cokeromyces recurvatus TaxID=90255 RepID=UPI00221F9EC7|nr:uncharacterized protein BX663DRAFT_523076 [Cokeromyces recurvatus]KAI7898860.1 hypothetical protein BX663DRAFT_523076 [Cokeromyces recurvatus]
MTIIVISHLVVTLCLINLQCHISIIILSIFIIILLLLNPYLVIMLQIIIVPQQRVTMKI